MRSPSTLRTAALVLSMIFAVALGASNRAINQGFFKGSYANVVEDLPGLAFTPEFDQYSGYVVINEGENSTHRYFWFLESENDPANDPLVLWLTGGPGCGGTLFTLFEGGPFRVSPDGTTLTKNPYGWNVGKTAGNSSDIKFQSANVIVIDSPSGVGFSFNSNQSYVGGDDITSQNTYYLLQGFLQMFPELQKNPFFISGESYGGHYVPQAALRVVTGNDAYAKGVRTLGETDEPLIPIAMHGITAGNPCTDAEIENNSYLTFMMTQQLVGLEMYAAADKACNGNFANPPNELCKELVANATKGVLYINPYDIDALCLGGGPSPNGACFTTDLETGGLRFRTLEDTRRAHGHRAQGWGSQTFVPCLDLAYITKYMSQPGIREALSIPAVGPLKEWYICSPIIHYNQMASTVVPTYHSIAGTKNPVDNTVLRILIYSGDEDTCVNGLGTQTAVIEGIAFPETKAWAPWNYKEQDMTQTAGYVVEYENNLSFATVIGASHMVPNSRPIPALVMVQRVWNDEPLTDE